MRFPETELILTSDKRVYHINLKAEDIADDVIVVGDQFRVAEISRFFSKIDFQTQHREFITNTGWFNGKRLTVLSTGIGTDNIDIVINELDAAVNINPETRELNPQLKSLNIIRLGTSGSLQGDVPVNGIVVSSHGIGLDGLLNFYGDWKSVNESDISDAFIKQTGWLDNLPYPYCVKGSEKLLEKFKHDTHIGITATAPGFYGPQGRQIRLMASQPNLNESLTAFSYKGLRITNFEMETSALYGLGKLLGHNCLTACVIIANRIKKEFTSDYKKSVELLIEKSLERLTA
jgi:uridine phosphorylase